MNRTLAPVRTLADLSDRETLVLGLARSGIAAARMLADSGARVTVYDRRSPDELADAVASLGGRRVELALGVDRGRAISLLGAAELVVTSPSISPRFPTTEPWLRDALRSVEESGHEVVSEVELFLRLTHARIAAVTGTKGKTTTTALLGAILERGGVAHRVGGNIGAPLIEHAGEMGADEWAVLELSELQLPTISRGADVAIYTNVGADHLDRHGTVEAYRAVKARLALLTAPAGGTVILNADDPGCRELGGSLSGDVRWYGFGQDALAAGAVGDRLLLGGESLMSIADVPLPGRHMLANVLAAALAASVMGVARDAIAGAVADFRGVPHRLETVAVRAGVRYVNDSQATIPFAAMAALEAFADVGLVLIAGGQGKGLEYGDFVDLAVRRARAAVLIGESADELEGLIAGRIPVVRAGSMDEAVAAAAGLARPGETVLLSPAAASFDMFTDYAARGDAFRAAVAGLDGAAP